MAVFIEFSREGFLVRIDTDDVEKQKAIIIWVF